MNNEEDAIIKLRAKLTGHTNLVRFTRIDGKIVTLSGCNIDSIGPSAESPMVVGVEFEDDTERIVHLPFIKFWEVEYL